MDIFNFAVLSKKRTKNQLIKNMVRSAIESRFVTDIKFCLVEKCFEKSAHDNS